MNSYCTHWYKFPPRTRVLIQMMMLRASHPLTMLAGPLFLMNFETYFKVRFLFGNLILNYQQFFQ